MRGGFVQMGRWRGVPLLLHWTLPVGAFLVGRLEVVPVFWLAFVAVAAIHAAGHVYFLQRFRKQVRDVRLTGWGGEPGWSGHLTPGERTWTAWGGAIAQLVLLAGTLAAVAVFGEPATSETVQLVDAFTRANVVLVMINLIPLAPFDGAEAWRLVRRIRARPMPPSPPSPPSPPERFVEPFVDLADPGFQRAAADVQAELERIADRVGQQIREERAPVGRRDAGDEPPPE